MVKSHTPTAFSHQTECNGPGGVYFTHDMQNGFDTVFEMQREKMSMSSTQHLFLWTYYRNISFINICKTKWSMYMTQMSCANTVRRFKTYSFNILTLTLPREQKSVFKLERNNNLTFIMIIIDINYCTIKKVIMIFVLAISPSPFNHCSTIFNLFKRVQILLGIVAVHNIC